MVLVVIKANDTLEWSSAPRAEIVMSIPVWLLHISESISDAVRLRSELLVMSINGFFR